MFKINFQKSKAGGLPAFAISMPDAKNVLQSVIDRADAEMAEWIVRNTLRSVNDSKGLGGIKLFDHCGDVWSNDKFQSILAEGMAANSSQTFTDVDFAHEWATGLSEIVAALVEESAVDKARATLAMAVKHGGAAQLKRIQHEAILRRFADSANEHDVIAIAVEKSRRYIAEDAKLTKELQEAGF